MSYMGSVLSVQKKFTHSMDSITKRINSPEYRRDMELPSELQGKATVIDNDDWQATKQKLDAFYLQVKKQTLDV